MNCRYYLVIILSVIFLLSGATILKAQNEKELSQADTYFQEEDYNNALELYKKLAKRDPENRLVWFRLGVSYYNLKEYEKAVNSLERAQEFEDNKTQTKYWLVRAYAGSGMEKQAINKILELAKNGFSGWRFMQNDAHLETLKNNKGFKLALEKVKENAYPCKTLVPFKKLDFWVGEWDVKTQEGRKVGENRIEKILSDCAIIENWTSISGGKGKSLFFFDPNADQWKQIWITENPMTPGGLKEKFLVEEFENGGVRFQGEYPDDNGNIILDRTTLTPNTDGTVRQLIEISTDNGETWNQTFDAVYVPRE